MAKSNEIAWSSNDRDLLRSLGRMSSAMEKMEKRLGKVTSKSKESDRAMDKAFGQQKLANISSMVTGFVSLNSAISKGIELLRHFDEEADRAVNRTLTVEQTERRLLQISGSTEQFEGLRSLSNDIRQEFGLTELDALNTTFQAGSAGQISGLEADREKDRERLRFFAELNRIDFEPAAAIESVQKIQSVFGKGKGLDERSILNKIIATAGPSPTLATDIAEAATRAAVPAKAIGFTDEELLGTLAVLSESLSPQESAQRIKSISLQILKKREVGRIKLGPDEKDLKGLDLLFALPRLESEGKLVSESGERQKLAEFLGETNAIEAQKLIAAQQSKIIQARDAALEAERLTGTPQSELNTKFAIARGDARLSASEAKRREDERRKIDEDLNLATPQSLADAVRNAEVTGMRAEGAGRVRIFATEGTRAAQHLITGPGEFLREFVTQPGHTPADRVDPNIRYLDEDLLRQILDVLLEQKKITEEEVREIRGVHEKMQTSGGASLGGNDDLNFDPRAP